MIVNYDVVDDNIESILYEISDSTIRFGKFQLTDYMNDKNFYIDTTEKIKASKGKVILDEINHSIKWEISNLYSGQKEHLSFKVKLQKESSSEEGTYPLITYADIDSVIDDKVEKINSNITPIIKDKYYVTYNENSPGVCKIEGVPNSESHFVFDNVPITESIPTCEGFQFKGWKVVTSDVEAVNNHYFTMPENDVELYGTWAKLDIKKSMSGTIGQKHTLYKQVQQDSNDPNKYVRKYEGDTSTFNGSEDVYYYYGAASNNNVIFANYCWKIVRTTETGGVKLIYNGIPSAENKCNNTGTASQLTAEQMNLSAFRISYNYPDQSPADVGYMNNVRYVPNIKNISSLGTTLYGNSYTYLNGVYTLQNTKTFTNSSEYTNFTDHHYTCFNTNGKCNTISYVYSVFDSQIFYMNLKEGKSIQNALNEMLYNDDVNKNSSIIKTANDYWFSKNMVSYTSFLEDTVWCNDRGILNLNGWNSNGNANSTYLYFNLKDYKNSSGNITNLTCPNKNDRFTVNPDNGNGALTYPVGLITGQELKLAYDSDKSPLATGKYYWTNSPANYYYGNANNIISLYNGEVSHHTVAGTTLDVGLRPAISLRNGIDYASGDGSSDYPYIVSTS